jgi:hypothetical protein
MSLTEARWQKQLARTRRARFVSILNEYSVYKPVDSNGEEVTY